jgi:predicted RNA-binding Zn ribbon-like protein
MPNRHSLDHGHEVDLETALDFVNTIDLDYGQLVEHFQVPADAATWFADRGVLHDGSGRPWREPDLARVRDVRGALRELVDAVVDDRAPKRASVEIVNDALVAKQPERLELDGSAIRVGHRHAASPVDDALARVAEPIVAELASGRRDRFRVCANDRCRWAFYDTSPAGKRRWCDMKSCGNQAKAARHRAKVRKEASPEPIRLLD